MKNVIYIMAFLMVQIVSGQNYTNLFFNGNGTRPAGMGNAYTAISQDVLAIAWNPAGLAHLDNMEYMLTVRAGYGSAKISGFDELGIDSWDIDVDSWGEPNFFAIATPLKYSGIQGGAGFAYRRIHNLTRQEVHNITGETVNGSLKFDQSISGGIDAFSLAFGMEAHKKILVGATLNFLMGSADGFNYLSLNSDSLSQSYREEYSGFMFNAGILIKPFADFTLGANIILPGTINAESKELDNIELEMPFYYTAGLGYLFFDKLQLAADYRYQPLGQAKANGKKLSDSNKIEDNHTIHVGAEYKIQTRSQAIPIRFGYYTNLQSKSVINAEHVYTLGGGYNFGGAAIDLAFEYANSTVEQTFSNIGTVMHDGSEFRVTFGIHILSL